MMGSFILILVLTFGNGSTGVITSTTVQVDNLTQASCEAMLRTMTTSVTGEKVNIRLSGCFKR